VNRRIGWIVLGIALAAACGPAAGVRAQTTSMAQDKGPVVLRPIDPDQAAGVPPERITVDMDWDLYYTSAAMIFNLTDEPIPRSAEKNELAIYRNLLTRSHLPRCLLLEASVYPMPCLGGFIKANAPELYEESEFVDGLNLVKTITAGFNEPYAVSLFTGNVVAFQPEEDRPRKWNHGYMGYLFSFGDYHIKDNEFIYDKWCEVEWKIKGDLSFRQREISWSFRAGAKIHDHPEINDSVYLSLRRSRVDYAAPADSFLNNSGFEYTFHADAETLQPISHFFSVDKKWPLPERRMAFSLAVGFVWEANRKYLGTLAREKGDDFQIFIRPNLTF